jgi:2-methylcitrate dehydratase PrpD
VAQTAYPKGHRHNPLSDADVEAKFRRLAGEVLTEQQCRTVLELLWSLERLPDLQALFDALVITPPLQ